LRFARFAIDAINIKAQFFIPASAISRQQSGSSDAINSLGMRLFVVAGVLAILFFPVMSRTFLQRRAKRENKRMRDHLSRISTTGDDRDF
jgi:hypothetical protein